MRKQLLGSALGALWVILVPAQAQFQIAVPDYLPVVLQAVPAQGQATCPAGYVRGTYTVAQTAIAAGPYQYPTHSNARDTDGFCKAGHAYRYRFTAGGGLQSEVLCSGPEFMPVNLARVTCDMMSRSASEHALLAERISGDQARLDRQNEELVKLRTETALLRKSVDAMKACIADRKQCQ
jgi:hypothetical protein